MRQRTALCEEDLLNLCICHRRVCERIEPAFMRIGQLQMIQPQRMQERRMQIVNANRVLRRFPPEFICAAMDVSLLKSAACDPKRERLPIVIAPVLALRNGKPPKLAGPEHDGRIEQASLLEVHDEG